MFVVKNETDFYSIIALKVRNSFDGFFGDFKTC